MWPYCNTNLKQHFSHPTWIVSFGVEEHSASLLAQASPPHPKQGLPCTCTHGCLSGNQSSLTENRIFMAIIIPALFLYTVIFVLRGTYINHEEQKQLNRYTKYFLKDAVFNSYPYQITKGIKYDEIMFLSFVYHFKDEKGRAYTLCN